MNFLPGKFYKMSNELSDPRTPRPERSVSLFDKLDDHSVVNLLPDAFAKAFDEAAFDAQSAHYFEMDEIQLSRTLRQENKSPTAVDNRLRLKFWMEYDRVIDTKGEKISIVNVVAGVCTKEYFYKAYVKYPAKIAWLLCPPSGYMTKAQEGLEFGLDQMREILDLPIDHQGKRDHKLMALKVQITKMLDDRVKGAVAQNLNINQKSLNVTATPSQVKEMAENLSMDQIEERLKKLKALDVTNTNREKLQAERASTPNPGDVIEVQGKHVK